MKKGLVNRKIVADLYKGFYKVFIKTLTLFIVGFICRIIINDIYNIDVFKEYLTPISIIYYWFMAWFVVFINCIFEWELKIIQDILYKNIYLFIINGIKFMFEYIKFFIKLHKYIINCFFEFRRFHLINGEFTNSENNINCYNNRNIKLGLNKDNEVNGLISENNSNKIISGAGSGSGSSGGSSSSTINKILDTYTQGPNSEGNKNLKDNLEKESRPKLRRVNKIETFGEKYNDEAVLGGLENKENNLNEGQSGSGYNKRSSIYFKAEDLLSNFNTPNSTPNPATSSVNKSDVGAVAAAVETEQQVEYKQPERPNPYSTVSTPSDLSTPRSGMFPPLSSYSVVYDNSKTNSIVSCGSETVVTNTSYVYDKGNIPSTPSGIHPAYRSSVYEGNRDSIYSSNGSNHATDGSNISLNQENVRDIALPSTLREIDINKKEIDGNVKLGIKSKFVSGINKIESLYIKYENVAKRKIIWFLFEEGKNNYESYDEFKKHWDNNTKLWDEVKKRTKADLKGDIEKYLGMNKNHKPIESELRKGINGLLAKKPFGNGGSGNGSGSGSGSGKNNT